LVLRCGHYYLESVDNEETIRIWLGRDGWIVATMVEFIKTEGCRRVAMSGYLDGQETACSLEEGMALCDRYGEGVAEWQNSQSLVARKWGVVRDWLDKLADNCAACWVMKAAEDAHLHAWGYCTCRAGLLKASCDAFRQQIFYERACRSYTRCGISQRFDSAGKEEKGRYQ